MKRIEFRGDYIQGLFELSDDPNGEWIAKSPAQESEELMRVRYSYPAIDRAVQGSKRALPAWKSAKVSERLRAILRYVECLKESEPEILRALALEVGKPHWDAKQEIEITYAMMQSQIKEAERFHAEGFRPLGSIAVIGPFSSPFFSLHTLMIPALWSGNTVVVKPSEKTPILGQIMAECMDRAQFPAGVFNLLHGEREFGRRLASAEGIDGIFFAGSYEVGVRIKQDTLQQHWKKLVLLMGAKNSAVIWEDADVSKAVRDTLVSAFRNAGQSSFSLSRVVVHRSIADEFISKLHEQSKGFKITHPFENPLMGPMIDKGSVDRYMKFVGTATREGAELIMRGKPLESTGFQGNYVTPTLALFKDSNVESSKKSIFQQTEILAPAISILPVEDWDHALALANATQYGWVASLYTESGKRIADAREQLQVGHFHVNTGTWSVDVGGPIGGFKKSGNRTALGREAWRSCGSFHATHADWDGQWSGTTLPPV